MTAQDLFELLNPLWLKHPGTRPARDEHRSWQLGRHPEYTDNFAWVHECDDPCCQADFKSRASTVTLAEVEMFAAIAIVKWLAIVHHGVFITHAAGMHECWYIFDQADMEGAQALGSGPTLIEALVPAAMAMEAE